nr:hypothetical protein [Tanacetum cinerariifolium]
SLSKKSYCLVITDDYSRFSWVFFLASKDETPPVLKTFIIGLENLFSLKVKVIRCDNRTEFKNFDLNQFCGLKGIKREFSVPRTPQQNSIAERKNRTLIEAARTLLEDSLLPIPFWAKAVNTACYVQNRVLVTKPHNKTPYELLHGRLPSIGFMRPFGCPVTILNTLDLLGKFQGKVDEGFLIGYSVRSKAFRVFNSRTRIVQETLHVNFMENKPNVAGSGPTWLFDIDSLTRTMNYHPVIAENQINSNAGFHDIDKAGEEGTQTYVLFLVLSDGSTNSQNNNKVALIVGKEHDDDIQKYVSPNIHSSSSGAQTRKQGNKTENKDKGKSLVVTITGFRDLNAELEECTNNSSNGVNAASSSVSTAGHNFINSSNDFSTAGPSNAAAIPTATNSSDMPNLEDLTHSNDADDVGVEADINNLEPIISVSPIPTTRIHKDHPTSQIIGDLSSTTQTKSMARTVRDQGGISQMFNEDFHTCMFACFLLQEEPKRVHQALKDPSFQDLEKAGEEGTQTYVLFPVLSDVVVIKQGNKVTRWLKGIKRGFSVPRTPQQNGIAERKNRTLIEAAKTLLADSLLPIPFWAEAVNTACYVQNRVLVTKPHNKTPYELLHGRLPSIGFMRPFGCPVTILNTLDPLGKFQGNVDEGFLVGYSVCSSGPVWLFDIDSLTQTMNYHPVLAANKTNYNASFQDTKKQKRKELKHIDQTRKQGDKTENKNKGKSLVVTIIGFRNLNAEFEDCNNNSSNGVNAASSLVSTAGQNCTNSTNDFSAAGPSNAAMPNLEDLSQDADDKVWILVDLPYGKRAIGTKWVYRNKRDERGIVIRNKASLVAQGHTQEEGIDYEEALCQSFEKLMKDKFQMSSMGELTFFLGLQVKQKKDGIFISQDKYVAEILKKFGLSEGKSASTPIDADKPLLKDLDAYSDSDYTGASLDRKSTTGGCQFLRCRLISWQCKKQTVVATSSTEAEYVFWNTAVVKRSDDVTRLQALVDKKRIVITKEVVREILQLNDAEGVICLPNEEIFAGLARMGYEKPSTKLTFYKAFFSTQWKFFIHTILHSLSAKRTSWNKFSSAMASAVICLSSENVIREILQLDDAEGVVCLPNEGIFTGLAQIGYEKPSTKLTFYKAFFSSQWKFLIHTILQSLSTKRTSWNEFSTAMASVNQVGDLSTHISRYISPALTQKVFANIRRVGKGFSEVETPFFEGMLAARQLAEEGIAEEQVQADVVVAAVQDNFAEDVDNAAIPSPPSYDFPSPSQEQYLPPQQPQSSPQAPLQGADFPTHIQQVLDVCSALTRRVKNLEHDKATQKLEIIKLKARVKRLERPNKVKSSKLRRLRKVTASRRIESSDDMEDVFNQGRMIDDMDKDEGIELVKDADIAETEGRYAAEQAKKQAEIYNLDLDHSSKVLSMQEDDSEEVVEIVTTAKLITNVVTAASQVSAASATISVAKPSIPTAAPTVVAAYTRRRKGVIIRDPEEELSLKTPTETPKLKDKGKGILIETPKPMKKKDQIELDAEYAKKLHEEINKDHE